MSGFRLTLRAAADLAEIGRFTEARWGRKQRSSYLRDFDAAFRRLATGSTLGRQRPELGNGLLSYRCGRHTIFFHRTADEVQILRILHERQTLRGKLAEK